MGKIMQLPETELGESIQRGLNKWLRLFIVIGLGAVALVPWMGEGYFNFVMVLPMINCFIVWAIMCIASFSNFLELSPSNLYIKEKYPQIWQRMHPWGDHFYNSFTISAFMAGKYDDGTDKHLQLIKERMRQENNLMVFPFAMILLFWAVAIP